MNVLFKTWFGLSDDQTFNDLYAEGNIWVIYTLSQWQAILFNKRNIVAWRTIY